MPDAWTRDDGPCLLCAEEHPKVLHIRLRLGEIDYSGERHWCGTCRLPSVLVVPVSAICCHGWPLAMTFPPIAVCVDHHGQVPLP